MWPIFSQNTYVIKRKIESLSSKFTVCNTSRLFQLKFAAYENIPYNCNVFGSNESSNIIISQSVCWVHHRHMFTHNHLIDTAFKMLIHHAHTAQSERNWMYTYVFIKSITSLVWSNTFNLTCRLNVLECDVLNCNLHVIKLPLDCCLVTQLNGVNVYICWLIWGICIEP